jgi:bifunctional DNA-binding transcriptional regulator/antitoxin component of YhaV-PrlF toxin-antitoxin module
MSKSWTISLEEDPETGDLIMPLSDEILESAGWKEGDTLQWIDNEDGSWILRKLDASSTDTTK